MRQKLTTLVLLSTVIGIGTGTSAEAASGSLLNDIPIQTVGVAAPVADLAADSDGDNIGEDSDDGPALAVAEPGLAPLPAPPEETGSSPAFSQSGTVISQVLNSPPPADSFPEPLPDPVPTPEPVLPTTPAIPAEPAEPAPEVGPTVAVQGFEVSGSTVFGEADFESALSPFIGQSLGIDELRQAADSITQLYLNEGYITSRAVLPNQPITDGIVQLQIIEGSLEEIRIEEVDRLASYVRSRINLGAKTPLNQFELEDQLRLLRADPLIDNIEASLRAGTGLGQSILVVRVDEADPFEAHL
ncbi:MAG: POTRA domain-containing protein, partial [Cyanobacteria bacterium P01_D01_bin.2]